MGPEVKARMTFAAAEASGGDGADASQDSAFARLRKQRFEASGLVLSTSVLEIGICKKGSRRYLREPFCIFASSELLI